MAGSDRDSEDFGSSPNSNLFDPNATIINVPKPASILAEEKRLGAIMEPYYATMGGGNRGTVEYGPPIGYSYANDKNQYVQYDASGNFIGTQDRGGADILKFVGAAALSFLLPYVGEAIAESLLNAGIVTSEVTANILGNAIANTAANVAQGQPLDKALTNAVVNAAVNTGSIEIAKTVNDVIGHPAVTNAIVSAGASAVKSAAAGGSEEDVAKAALSGLVSSGTTSAVKNALDVSPNIANIIGAGAGGAVAGGTAGAITSALSTAASQLGTPTPTPVAEVPMDAQGVLAAFDEAAKKDYINSSTAFAGVGMLPAATAETQALLARLASTPAGQAALREAASASEKIRTAIVATGIVSAGALSGFIGGQSLVPKAQTDMTTRNPAFDLIPTTGGDPGTAAAARTSFAETDPRRVDTSTQTPPAPPPVKVETQRVAQNLNISLDEAAKLQNTNPVLYDMFGGSIDTDSFTPADIETMPLRDRLILENIVSGAVSPTGIEIPAETITAAETSPTAAGENVVIAVDANTGDALIISPTGVVSTVKVEPDTRTGTSVVYDPQARIIINPQTNTITSIDTNITSRVDSSKISEAVNTATSEKAKTATAEKTKPATDISTAPETKTKTATDTLSGPLVQPSTSVQPKAEESLAPTTPTTPSVTTPTEPPSAVSPVAVSPVAVSPPAKTTTFTFKIPSATTPEPTPKTTPEPTSKIEKTPTTVSEDVSKEEVPADKPYKPKITTKTVVTKKPPTSPVSVLSQALGTTGLTAYRGAGEIEDPSTGKKRRKVWNEETLRLKDALGV